MVRTQLGTGEIEILAHVAADPRNALELRPGGLWTTPSTGIHPGGWPHWWAVPASLNHVRLLGLLRFRLGPKAAGGTSFPELELTPAGLAAIDHLRSEGKIQ